LIWNPDCCVKKETFKDAPMTIQNTRLFIISLGFDAFWLFCVVMQGHFLWFATLMLGLALWFDKTLVVAFPVIASIGIFGDFLLTVFGVFQFPDAVLSDPGSLRLAGFPLWLILLWFGFAAYAWLMRQAVLKYSSIFLALICAFSGAFSYYAGMKLGAVSFPFSLSFTLSLLFVLWMFYGFLFYFLIAVFCKILDQKSVLVNQEQALKLDIKY